MPRYTITYRRTVVQEWIEFKNFESLAAAYQHATDTIALQDENPTVHDGKGWHTDHDLMSRVECAEIMDDGNVTHIYTEIPADLAVVANPPPDTIDTLEIAEDIGGLNDWDGVVDRIEELGQADKDLFGPVS